MDTIYALSSGRVPSAVAVVRLSGPAAGPCVARMTGGLPPPRAALLRRIADEGGLALDCGLVLWFPGPSSFTGEDCAEFHLHGGRAVVEGVMSALSALGARLAAPGEF